MPPPWSVDRPRSPTTRASSPPGAPASDSTATSCCVRSARATSTRRARCCSTTSTVRSVQLVGDDRAAQTRRLAELADELTAAGEVVYSAPQASEGDKVAACRGVRERCRGAARPSGRGRRQPVAPLRLVARHHPCRTAAGAPGERLRPRRAGDLAQRAGDLPRPHDRAGGVAAGRGGGRAARPAGARQRARRRDLDEPRRRALRRADHRRRRSAGAVRPHRGDRARPGVQRQGGGGAHRRRPFRECSTLATPWCSGTPAGCRRCSPTPTRSDRSSPGPPIRRGADGPPARGRCALPRARHRARAACARGRPAPSGRGRRRERR